MPSLGVSEAPTDGEASKGRNQKLHLQVSTSRIEDLPGHTSVPRHPLARLATLLVAKMVRSPPCCVVLFWTLPDHFC